MESPAARIIELFGGVGPMARELGHKHPTTVAHWKKTGRIPQKRWDEVIAIAERCGHKIDYRHFFEVR